MMLRVTCS